MRRTGFIVALGFAGLTALAVLGFSLGAVAPAVGTEADKGFLADSISRVLSSPGMQVSIGAVDGALSSDATIRDIVIADAQGPWLKLDRAHIQWTRSALLARRLEINSLEIGRLEILRRPLPGGGTAAPSTGGSLLPELPVKVNVGHFVLDELALGETLAGSAARLSAQGKASLGNPAEGLDLSFDAHRLDAPGSIAIKLAFVPKSTDLTLQILAQEPAGGLLAHLAAIPGLPPVALDLNGNGPLDHFASRLAFSAGPDAGADGTLNLVRDGAARRLALDLSAHVAAFLPPGFAPLFAGATQLAGNVRLGDDGSVGFDQFALVARTARLDVSGGIGAGQSLDLHVAAHALPATGADADGRAVARRLDLDIDATGTIPAPRLDASLAIADLIVPAGRFARFDARLQALPSGRLLDAATTIHFAGSAQGFGLAFADPKWADALGDNVTANLDGTTNEQGDADSTARFALPGADISYAGKAGPDALRGRLAAAADLGRFALLAGRNLGGRASLNADLDGVPNQGQIAAVLSGAVQDAATGIPFLDGLTAGQLAINGKVEKKSDGFAFSDLRLTGGHVTAHVDGTATMQTADVAAVLDLPDLHYGDARLRGRANLTAALKGSLAKPDANLRLSISDASALGRAIPRLVVATDITDPFGAMAAQTTLDGEVGGKPAHGEIGLFALPDGGWRLDPSQLTIGSAALTGTASLDKTKLATGHLALAIDNLDDLSPFALQKLAGRIKADVNFDSASGRQNASVKAQASGVRAGGTILDRLDADMRFADLLGAPIADGMLAAGRLVVAGETIPHFRIDAKGSPQGTQITLSGEARGFTIGARAALSTAAAPRLDLAMFEARRGKSRIALAAPASLRFADSTVATDNFALAVDGGRLEVKGRAGASLDLAIGLHNLPLSAAALLDPKLDLAGTLDGAAHIAGSAAAPSGDWQVKISRFAAAQARGAGLPLLDLTAAGRLAGNATSLDATISAAAHGALHLTGSVPIRGQGALDITAKGTLDAALANVALAAGGQKLAGKLTLDARATGSASAPQVSGSAAISGGSFSDPASGVKFADINAQVSGRGESIDIASFSATTPNGGTLSASGEVKLSPEAGFPGHLTISGKHAQLAANDLVSANADLDLQLSGALAQRPRIDGSVTLQSMDISVPERLPVTLRPLPGTQHVEPGATATLRLDAEKRSAAVAARAASPFDTDLRVKVFAPNRIFVRGRGIDAEFGGELALAGSLAKPVITGAFDMRSGRLNLLSQRLDMSHGRLTFAGELEPELDFVADARSTDVTAQVTVSGRASAPVFALTSTPSLPQDEILSRIMFQKPAGGLSPVQAIQLAQMVAQLSGSGAGLDVFEKMRKTLGVDSLDVQTDAQGKASVGASRYISNNVNVGVTTGANPQSSSVTLGVDLTKRLRAQGAVGMDGNSSVGLGMEWEY